MAGIKDHIIVNVWAAADAKGSDVGEQLRKCTATDTIGKLQDFAAATNIQRIDIGLEVGLYDATKPAVVARIQLSEGNCSTLNTSEIGKALSLLLGFDVEAAISSPKAATRTLWEESQRREYGLQCFSSKPNTGISL